VWLRLNSVDVDRSQRCHKAKKRAPDRRVFKVVSPIEGLLHAQLKRKLHESRINTPSQITFSAASSQYPPSRPRPQAPAGKTTGEREVTWHMVDDVDDESTITSKGLYAAATSGARVFLFKLRSNARIILLSLPMERVNLLKST
jgi:hypothetical protein